MSPPVIILSSQTPAGEPYRPAAEKIRSGDPVQTVVNGFSSTDGRFNCGVWSGEVGCWSVSFTENEFCLLLSGRVRVQSEGGESWAFGPGDAFVMPAGFIGSWEVLEPARKYYAVYE